jgi:hypothetical protein
VKMRASWKHCCDLAQARVSAEAQLRWVEADEAALAAATPDRLAELASQLEVKLARVRSAQLVAAARSELACPVCWERRKGMVFQCGGWEGES